MINIKFVLFFSFVFFFISKPSQAQEEKEIDIPNHIVDVFWGSDTIKMAEYIKSGEYPFGYKP